MFAHSPEEKQDRKQEGKKKTYISSRLLLIIIIAFIIVDVLALAIIVAKSRNDPSIPVAAYPSFDWIKELFGK